jgi:beta-lactamase class A
VHAALDALNKEIEGPFEPRPLISDPWLEDIIRQRLGDDIEQYSIVVKRFRDGRGVSINEASVHNAASLFKLEVLYGVFSYRSAGLLDFDESLLISYEFAEYDLGTLPWAFGEVVPISQLVEAMITFSDNVSALVLYSRVGWSNLHSLLQAIGLQDSVIDEYNLTTSARDMAILLEAMACGEAIDPDSSSEMIEVLTRQELNSKIPALLPPDVKVAHKTGEWDDAAHDVGIVFAPSGEYLVAILSSHGWANDTIAEISALIYEYLESHP